MFKPQSHLRRQYPNRNWRILESLLEGPKTLPELKVCIRENGEAVGRRLGLFDPHEMFRVCDRASRRLPQDLESALQAGWVERKGEQYALTELGRQTAQAANEHVRLTVERLRGLAHRMLSPEWASKVTIGIQLALACMKLPAGLMSGSVRLINDSADTILDLFAGILVYLGIRLDRESLVNVILAAAMSITGLFSLAEAAHQFFAPATRNVDGLTFAAAALSAGTSLVLWTYQRWVGIESGHISLITQSVDSRNHIIVAASVMAGLIGCSLGVSWLDDLVGLAVALLILQSAFELAVESLRPSRESSSIQNHYGLWLDSAYRRFKETLFEVWLLHLVETKQVRTYGELAARARRELDFRDNRWLELVGLNQALPGDQLVESTIKGLTRRGWILDAGGLILTPEGSRHLHRRDRKSWRASNATA